MNRALAVSCVAVMLTACNSGGSSDGGDLDGGTGNLADAGSTVVTLAGAVSGTATVGAATTTYTPATGLDELDVRATVGGLTTQVAFFFSGLPAAATYVANTDAGIDCSLQIFVADGGLDGWAANFGSGLPDLGACSLSLTSSAMSADHGTQKIYSVHGALSATAPAHGGAATGTVTYSAHF